MGAIKLRFELPDRAGGERKVQVARAFEGVTFPFSRPDPANRIFTFSATSCMIEGAAAPDRSGSCHTGDLGVNGI